MGPWVREADNRQPPRIPQEVPLGGTVHRLPLRDDTTLSRSFGSGRPSFSFSLKFSATWYTKRSCIRLACR